MADENKTQRVVCSQYNAVNSVQNNQNDKEKKKKKTNKKQLTCGDNQCG